MRYTPSLPAMVVPAVDVPDVARTSAPATGADVVLSVIRPPMEPVCARAGVAVVRARHRKRRIQRRVILTSCRRGEDRCYDPVPNVSEKAVVRRVLKPPPLVRRVRRKVQARMTHKIVTMTYKRQRRCAGVART